MIRFYFNAAPNPMKVALLLEELGLGYEPVPLDTKAGEQHGDAFRAINPNGKVPALTDGEAVIFDSNAILLYLADKTGRFLPADGDVARGALLSWLMFVASGVGPYSGQAVHFRHFAKDRNAYAFERYRFEARRHWQIVEDRLGQGEFMLGGDYTIADMAVWGWADRLVFMLGDGAMADYPNVARLQAWIEARPAAARARALPKAHPFRQEMDDEAVRHMYPQLHAMT